MPFFVGTGVTIVVIIAIAFYSSVRFSSLAEIKGYAPVKAKRYPWVIAAATFTLVLFGQLVLSFFSHYEIWLLWAVFAVVLMVTVLRRAYKNIQDVPDRVAMGCNTGDVPVEDDLID